ncbi:LuxR C-terminal-related transcriptional regulator [Acrocarpospora phusangensis]|nr:LuxR C-terminal-related transcriptional regulator [Acrocarpospora phusangensis]
MDKTLEKPGAEVAMTSPELAVLNLLGSGLSTARIAETLGVTTCAVEASKRGIYRKLGVVSQAHAVARAIELGFFDHHRPVPDSVRTRPEVVVVHARPSPCRDRVSETLVASGQSFAVLRDFAGAHWLQWRRGTVAVVLIDPEPEDWRLPAGIGAPTLVVCSAPPDVAAVGQAVRHGARALVWREDVTEDLSGMLSLMCRGYFTMTALCLDAFTAGITAHPPELTARERDVLNSIALGHTIGQTARRLGITAKTVESVQARLFLRLGARTRSEALIISHRLGLVDWSRDESS